MTKYTQDILVLESNYKNYLEVKAKVDDLAKQLKEKNNLYITMLEAQQLLTTVSDANTKAILPIYMSPLLLFLLSSFLLYFY